MSWYFTFFFLSGFCSILYELVWLRLSMAEFGVTTGQVSIVLSMFMAGMGLGSWLGGVLMRRSSDRIHFHPVRLYALTEFLIGCSSLAVPAELVWGGRIVESMGGSGGLSSGSYYLASGQMTALILLPWCAFMGATYPVAMAAIERDRHDQASRSFSYLYLANVIGAVAGASAPLILVELYGFHGTLRVGAVLNVLIATLAIAKSMQRPVQKPSPQAADLEAAAPPASLERSNGPLLLLFLTGLATMGMEVVWIRLFTPYLGPMVYAFAAILAAYLVATFAGSTRYRFVSRDHKPDSRLAWVSLAFFGLLPLITSDPRLEMLSVLRVFIGVAPFAAVIGFLTPMLVDQWSGGDPDRAGRAYAVNVVGCIVGPLLSGFILLPLAGEHVSMLIYVLPWMAMAFFWPRSAAVRTQRRAWGYALIAAALAVFFLTRDFATEFVHREVLRDSTATVIATGSGMRKRLITNGVGITSLTPITKMMAHLTLASLEEPPRNALVICFGMGTTYRSVMSWGIPTTAVELIPSVPKLFSYYHDDGAELLRSPMSHLVIDDGRRYMERSRKQFDAIIIDPPPPIQAAASSLLYSKEFYAVAKERLAPGGILQQWLPDGDRAVQSAVADALKQSFPYVRVYGSLEGWGWHFLASMSPIPQRSAQELVSRMPAKAVADMMEWGPATTPQEQFELVLDQRTSPDQLIDGSPRTPAMQDDRPINEYFLLRYLRRREHASSATQLHASR